MSSKIDDGGPAFDHAGEFFWADDAMTIRANQTNNGLSIRDYFAAAALQGFLSNQALATIHQSELAKGAYEYADAMLQARKGGG
jgi:hypothetical protein